jgi:hypothetical protein
MSVELPEWNAYTCNKIDFAALTISFLLLAVQVAVLLSTDGSGHVLQTDKKGPISSSKPSDSLLREESKQQLAFRLWEMNDDWMEWTCTLVGLQFSTYINLLYVWLNKQ